jgi:transposase
VAVRFISANSDQVFLLPPDARDWLPRRHLAWEITALVDGFDLSGFLADYRLDGRSRPAYHPALMVALLLYCHCKGVRSSRAIETACYDDVGCRVIAGNRQPDHATIARFVARHREAVKRLFLQGLTACARDGLVTVDLVAGDGTKVKANASMAANVTGEQLEIAIGELEALLAAEVDEWFAQAEAADAAEDALFGHGDDAHGDDAHGDDAHGGGADDGGADDGGGPVATPSPLRRVADTLVRRRAARKRLAEEDAARRQAAEAQRRTRVERDRARVAARERALQTLSAQQQAKVDDHRRRTVEARAAGGNGADGRVPVPVTDSRQIRRTEQALRNAEQRLDRRLSAPTEQPDDKPPRVNTTDPSSRVMRGKSNQTLQGYNTQIVANRRQIILGIGTHDNPADVAALHPMLDLTRANLDAAGIRDPIGAALFDAGYASAGNFATPCEPTLYVAVTKEARQTGRTHGDIKIKKGWEEMTSRLDTAEGKRLYKQRAGIIEPIFAQLFQRLGRHLHHRGDAVDTELHLWATTHNLLKLIRHRANAAAATTPAPSPATA